MVTNDKEKTLIRHALSGRSVIDWPRLYFKDPVEVKNFLKINEFDIARQRDLDRLFWIHNEAVGYLKIQLRYDLAPEILKPDNITDLFLFASDKNHPLQKQACSTLKTMNIINHIDGRELLYNCPISLRDLFSSVEDKVERSLSALNRATPVLVKYQGGRKAKESLITKLLCKRETIAAKINDRVRYRIITRKKEDILKVIVHLFDTVLPFNYVIPSSSTNQLVGLTPGEGFDVLFRQLKRRLSPKPKMEFTGSTYKVCKFVVDIPIRLDNFLANAGGPGFRESLGTIAYVLVEFQVVDEETDLRNNSGKNSHDNYKTRQKKGVLKRLTAD